MGESECEKIIRGLYSIEQPRGDVQPNYSRLRELSRDQLICCRDDLSKIRDFKKLYREVDSYFKVCEAKKSIDHLWINKSNPGNWSEPITILIEAMNEVIIEKVRAMNKLPGDKK